MKPIRVTELFANIKANRIAFVSIAIFVSLGVGLFVGIGWGGTALRNAIYASMQDGRFHDIEIQFPYGLTEDDLTQVAALEEVSELEKGYSSFALIEDGSLEYVLKVQSMTSMLDQPIAIEGNLPMERNEIALLRFWAEDEELRIGDTISLKHDVADASDEDGMKYLTSDSFTITALVDNPAYLYKNSDMIGISNVGSGSIDCVGFVTLDAIDTSAFGGAYSNAYVRCASLDGKNTFSQEYRDAVMPIVKRIENLGKTLGEARYNKIHDEAQTKLTQAESQIADGERQLLDAERQIEEGEQQLATGQQTIEDGERELNNGKQDLAAVQVVGTEELAEGYRKLADGQARYDAGVMAYEQAERMYGEAHAAFERIHAEYDAFVATYNQLRMYQTDLSDRYNEFSGALDAYNGAPDEQKDGLWPQVESSYQAYVEVRNALVADLNAVSRTGNYVATVMGVELHIDGDHQGVDGLITKENANEKRDEARGAVENLGRFLDNIAGASYTVSDVTIMLLDIPGGLRLMRESLDDTSRQLGDAKAELDAGWDLYFSKRAEYDIGVSEGRNQIDAGQRELDDGKRELEQRTGELEAGKQLVAQKSGELETGKEQLADARDQFDQLVKYEWSVISRVDTGEAQSTEILSGMMDNMKWAMALLFVLVGLFVCYSAISRLVHEQIVGIGTKKAMGFRAREVTASYLWFSGLSVLLGVLGGLFMAVVVVQGISNPVLMNQYSIPAYGPYVDAVDMCVMGGLELVLILAATWFAAHGLLKREALDLLRGESTANAKEHFYERWAIWQRMSLYSQTIVNNCVNDRRRVVGTLVGVVGCTALIVVAMTLYGNVAQSLVAHYANVYSFDSIVYLDESSQEKVDEAAKVLYDRGMSSAPVYTTSMIIRKPDGSQATATMMIPTSLEAFEKFYNVTSLAGEHAEIENGDLWISAAYSEHMGVKAGDEITLSDYTGKTHAFTVAGVFDYYLMRHEFVLSQNEYRQAFGERPAPNALLANTEGADYERTCDALHEVDGFAALKRDRELASYGFNVMLRLLSTVVYVYLALSALMAALVLLNLNVMFVEEKKRELIVLMICGFSTEEAKAYIYRDSIALTILGIVLGVVLGSVMGNVTVVALEPFSGYFIRGINTLAVFAGAIGSGVFSAVMLLISLRRIPRFDLTDINRF